MYFALTAGGSSTRWQTSAGEPTAAVWGFARELLRVLEQEKPEYLAVAFDTGKTFRDDIYPDYKGTREKMPDDLRSQIERIRELVDAFNIPRLEMEGYEADDVLGSIARAVGEKGMGAKIITGDRDLLQLVSARTAVYLAGDDQLYLTDADVMKKLGVRADQVVDYKAIVGDKSDNIPGVMGVGEKTACSLLEKFGTLDQIYSHLPEVETRWRTKLEAGKNNAYLSHELARIRTDLTVPLDIEQAKSHIFDQARIEAFFNTLEFRGLIKQLRKITGTENAEVAVSSAGPGGQLSMFRNQPVAIDLGPSDLKVNIVDTPAKLADLTAELSRAQVIAFDTETTSTDEMSAQLVGISLATKKGSGHYIPVGHLAGENLPIESVINALRGPMTDARIPKVAHNAKYDYIMLSRYGLVVQPLGFDTMIGAFVADPSSRKLGLKDMALNRLGEEMTSIEQLIGKGKHQLSMAEVAIESAGAYAAADAETTLRLMPLVQADVERANGNRILQEIEMPLIPVLAEMEMTGIRLDTPFYRKLGAEMSQRILSIQKDITEAVGRPFNINSTQQLSDVLFNLLKLEPPDRSNKTASGHYSTSADVLEAMRDQHPVVNWILEQRELSKLVSTYIEALPEKVDPRTGRIHTSYKQTGAVTGRLSSEDPNLQNIPIRTEEGRRVRRGFIADPGSVLLSVDYSQIELRIIAFMSRDDAMLAAFRAGQDIHAATAAAINNIPLEQVTKDQRRNAKAINFGLMYGMSSFGLTRSTDLTQAESENFVKAYYKQFPGVKSFLDGLRKTAAQDGYVETLLGRRRYFPLLKSGTAGALRGREEREAINAPIQGSAADLMKIAMLHLPPALKKAGLAARMLLQVHDELVLEVPKSELRKAARITQEVMSSAYEMDIPLSTDAKWGDNWGEMQALEERS